MQRTKRAGSLVLAILLGPDLGEPLGGVLRIGAQGATGEDDCFLAISHGSGVDLTQIYRGGVCTRLGFRQAAIFEDQMPGGVARPPVPYPPRFPRHPLREG